MHLQGPVPLEDADYAERPFERDLVRQVQAGRWVLMLGPRQHGKTSALLRLRRTLNENATQTVLVDLQKAPPFETYAQLIMWFAGVVSSALRHNVQIAETNALEEALSAAVPPGVTPLVILIDEASSIENEAWRNAFYGQVRAISSETGAAEDEQIHKRVRFVFAGTFRSERLVAEANSPFNICHRIDTADLTIHDVKDLVSKSGVSNTDDVAVGIYEAVAGQPFLVQTLIQAALGSDDPMVGMAEEVERLAESDHISNLFRRVVGEEALISIVSAVARDGRIVSAAGDEGQRFLIVLGLLRREQGHLVFRNRLYAETAQRSPQFVAQIAPDVAQRAVLFPMDVARFSKLSDPRMQEIAFNAQKGAVGSYRDGGCRIALAGFGAAMEAVLMDFLMKQSGPDLATAAAKRVNPGRSESAADPTTWTLFNLMKGVRGLLNQGDLDIPENLRQWRNLIHPGVSIQNYKEDGVLAPEVGVAANQLDIILRDLP